MRTHNPESGGASASDANDPSGIRALPQWLSDTLTPTHIDFESRVVCLDDTRQWLPTSLHGVDVRVMEYIPGPKPRLAAQLRFSPGHQALSMDKHPDLEVLIQQGSLSSKLGDYHNHWYYRLPNLLTRDDDTLTFERSASMPADKPALLYLAVGQMKQTDTQWRQIDTTDENGWFPGPVDGTDVMPLHGHGAGNVMLVRWNRTVAFKTRIDPRGEELLVLNGAVYDAQGSYPKGAWVRNPIAAWQAWGAKAGTMIYYKNGHFAHSDEHP